MAHLNDRYLFFFFFFFWRVRVGYFLFSSGIFGFSVFFFLKSGTLACSHSRRFGSLCTPVSPDDAGKSEFYGRRTLRGDRARDSCSDNVQGVRPGLALISDPRPAPRLLGFRTP